MCVMQIKRPFVTSKVAKKGHVAFLEKASINHLVHLIDYAEFIAVKHFHIHFANTFAEIEFAIKLVSCLITIRFID